MKPADKLSENGYKLTKQRIAVMKVIASNNEHLNPDEVYEMAKAYCPRIGLTTVYRTLEILDRLGIIRRVHMDDGCHGYAPVSEGHHHHLVCTMCGRVVEFEGGDLSNLLEEVTCRTGFEIKEHWLEFFGICPLCQ